jgi:uncharacterized protein (DUF1330 family)
MDTFYSDVFAEEKYAGNQLAVFGGNGNLDDTIMQKIAREMNYSETIFILKNGANNEYDVRIFTPEHEVPFAGHPSLGTAHIISNFVKESRVGGGGPYESSIFSRRHYMEGQTPLEWMPQLKGLQRRDYPIMSVYFVAHIGINDFEGYEKYLARCDEVFAHYGGEYLAVDDNPDVLEGDWSYTKTVLIRFPDEVEFRRWYESPEYQNILKYRLRAGKCDTVLVKGK